MRRKFLAAILTGMFLSTWSGLAVAQSACAQLGLSCRMTHSAGRPSGGYAPVYTPPPGPSPEELRRRAEAKDLQEAADDAQDKAVDAYERGDYQQTISLLKEALSYEPDDQGLQNALGVAQKKLSEQIAARQAPRPAPQVPAVLNSEAAREATSAGFHGNIAATSSSSEGAKLEASKVFDQKGKDVGGIKGSAVIAKAPSDPVVPAGKRTPAIAKLESQRTEERKKLAALEEKKKAIDPKKDPVALAKVKQDISNVENQVHYINFRIDEQLKMPTQAAPAKTEKSTKAQQ
ncbi:MAG TPA: hypothetical protein VF786_05830 [Terriglobales bacterium]